MKASIARHLSGQPKVYRLGLMGLSGAGKSCILAALGMRRVASPKGYTATRLADLPNVVNRPILTDRDTDPVGAFYAGAKWLAEVEAALAEGRPVAPNPPSARLLALYNFTFPGRGGVWVELIDYSGELLSQTNEALTVNLRRHLERLDGLLILAEAPASGCEGEQLPDELHRLQRALKTLSGQLKQGAKWDVPVALLFNKWDRRSIPLTDDEARDAIDRLLAESPAHRSLYDDLANTVISNGVKPFAVSAFGESERHQPPNGPVHERPVRRSPLPSFGLEDPFAWAICERDQIDWRRFGLAGGKARWFEFWRIFGTRKVLARGKDLVRRYSPEQPEHHGATTGTRKVLIALRCQTALWALLLALFLGAGWLAAETSLDSAAYSRVQTALDGKVPDLSRLEESSAWLAEYADSGWHRHLLSSFFVLSSDDARKKLAECQERSVEWNALVRGNENDMIGLEFEVNEVLAGVGLARLDAALAQLNKLPRFPEADAPQLQDRRAAAQKKLAGHQVKLQAMRADQRVKRLLDEYDGHMKAQKVVDAARLVAEAEGQLGDRLRADFCKSCLPKLREIRRRKRNAGEFAALVRELKEVYDSRYVIKLLSRDEREKIAGLLGEVKREWDRDLYETFKKDRKEEDGRRYQREAPLQRMVKKVEEYLKYLESRRMPQKFTLSLAEIYWNEWWDNYENNVEVKLGGDVVIDTTATAHERKRSSDIGSYTFTARESDSLQVVVRIVNVKGYGAYGIFRQRPGGTATFTGSPTELRDKTMDLTNSPKALGATVTLTITSNLKEPTLPDWSE